MLRRVTAQRSAPSWWVRVGVVVLVLVLPALLLLAVRALPAGCTDGQQRSYGAAGCERDIESRND